MVTQMIERERDDVLINFIGENPSLVIARDLTQRLSGRSSF
jgi:hypothetical protein